MEKRPIRSGTALALWLGGIALFLWLLAMAVLTWVTAYTLDRSLSEQSWRMTDNLISMSRLQDWVDYYAEEPQEVKDAWIWESMASFGDRSHTFGGGLLRSVQQPAQTAAVLYDGNGKLLEKNENAFYFQFMTENTWKTAESDMVRDGTARALYDRSEIEGLALQVLRRKDWMALRFTGVLEDGFLTPSKIEYISDSAFHSILFDQILPKESGRYSFERHALIQEMEAKYGLEWQMMMVSDFSHPEQQVYYVLNGQVSWYDSGEPIRQDGKTYENLMAWLQELGGQENPDFLWKYDRGSLWDRVMCRSVEVYENPKVESPLAYRMLSAVRYSPMKLTMAALVYIYVGSFVLVLLAVLLLWFVLRKHLIEPLREYRLASETWRGVSHRSRWRELWELDQRYYEIRREREHLQDEQIRLEKALDYAREAETNRRRMTSSIAHELKTPLAVIHSYAEGLQERIAEEKRERYLQVILTETERMDGMVMEMLDLSRLEAGKVKLNRELFSLTDLTADILERLSLKAQERKLQMRLESSADLQITADEGRIGQVITNFLSNAVRYTPEGGWIRVQLAEDRFHTWFWVENVGVPLSEQELSSVWDTFYRADPSRSGEGTGLGLAISKNIIELHGGTCQVRNTQEGVEFGFRLRK